MDWKLVLQIAGVVLGLLYLWLEYRADIRLWVVGLIMPLVHCTLLQGGAVAPTARCRPTMYWPALRVDRMA